LVFHLPRAEKCPVVVEEVVLAVLAAEAVVAEAAVVVSLTNKVPEYSKADSLAESKACLPGEEDSEVIVPKMPHRPEE
jgi:hypothetical protein